MLCDKFGWNWPNGSGEERWKFEKFTDRQTDDGQQVIWKNSPESKKSVIRKTWKYKKNSQNSSEWCRFILKKINAYIQ